MSGNDNQRELFGPRPGPLVHSGDPASSIEAADSIRQRLNELQRLVLEAFRRHGPMTYLQAQALPEFAGYGHSTVQKRISELSRSGYLEVCGKEGRSRIFRIPDDND